MGGGGAGHSPHFSREASPQQESRIRGENQASDTLELEESRRVLMKTNPAWARCGKIQGEDVLSVVSRGLKRRGLFGIPGPHAPGLAGGSAELPS